MIHQVFFQDFSIFLFPFAFCSFIFSIHFQKPMTYKVFIHVVQFIF